MALDEAAIGSLAFNAAGRACQAASIHVHLYEREDHYQVEFAFCPSDYFDANALIHMGGPGGYKAIVIINVS